MKSSPRPPGTPTKFPDCFYLRFCLSRRVSALLLSLVVLSLGPRPAHAESYKYKVLYSFTGPTSDGDGAGFLLREPGGTMYGTTIYGGTSYDGTVFKLSAKGKESIVYNFDAGYGNLPNSLLPYQGKFYGATTWGGASGGGTIFRLDKKGDETVLYNFPRNEIGPGLYLVDDHGTFYGTTISGGAGGYGTVFKIDRSGHLTILYSFTGGSDGRDPCCLVRDEAGNLYGYTSFPNSADSVFKLDSSGSFTTLYAFTGGADGYGPSAGPVLDSSGNLYGGTIAGGNGNCHNIGCGVLFKLDPSGHETVLYNFTGSPDGVGAGGPLILDDHGSLYGITWYGGDPNCYKYAYTPGCGVVFKMDADGKESVLHAFHVLPDGEFPTFLIMDSAGDLYGTTFSGGDSNCMINSYWAGCGTVFELTP